MTSETLLKKVKVGVVQATPAFFNVKKTIEIICEWINKASLAGCELLLFPESFISCYPRGLNFDAVIGKRTQKSQDIWMDYWQSSLAIPSEHTKIISEIAKKTGIIVVVGVTEKEVIGGSLYCSMLYFNSDGAILGKHRKLKPTGLERYIWAEGDGNTLTTIESKIGVLGGLICWENYMPLARMAMYQKGVEIYLAPTADSRESWQATMQHIALEGRCFVLGCNQFARKSDYPERYQSDLGQEPDILSAGGSVIISPMGHVLAGPLWNQEGLLTAELDLSDIIKAKLDFDCIGHYSRPDIFKYEAINQPESIKLTI